MRDSSCSEVERACKLLVADGVDSTTYALGLADCRAVWRAMVETCTASFDFVRQKLLRAVDASHVQCRKKIIVASEESEVANFLIDSRPCERTL